MAEKKNTVRGSISADKDLVISLRGSQWQKSTECGILNELCEAIWANLEEYFQPPQNKYDSLNVSK